MSDHMQIRDLITTLQGVPDPSDRVLASTEKGDQRLAILCLGKVSPRMWGIEVEEPSLDEDALDREFAKGYNKARQDAIAALSNAGHAGSVSTIESLEAP